MNNSPSGIDLLVVGSAQLELSRLSQNHFCVSIEYEHIEKFKESLQALFENPETRGVLQQVVKEFLVPRPRHRYNDINQEIGNILQDLNIVLQKKLPVSTKLTTRLCAFCSIFSHHVSENVSVEHIQSQIAVTA